MERKLTWVGEDYGQAISEEVMEFELPMCGFHFQVWDSVS